MNILALSYLFPNPAQPNYGIFVLNRLHAVHRNCTVKIVAPLQWFPLVERFRIPELLKNKVPHKLVLHGIEVYHPRFFSVPRYMKWLDSFSYLAAVLPVVANLRQQGFDFDLVDVHWTYPDILAGYVISRYFDKPFLVTIRGREALYLGERGGRKRILDWMLKKANAVVVLSSELKDLVQSIGVAPDRVRVILNGVDAESFTLLNSSEARRRLGLSIDKKIIISVGSLIERKGHHEIIKLLPEINKRFDIEFYVIGDVNPEGDFTKSIKHLVAELGLENVNFVNKVNHSELVDWYNAADLFCLATKGEGCPNVVMEALACGTPVVVSDVGAVTDLLDDGSDGYIVRNLGELASCIDSALARKWDRYMISLKMQARTWDACAEEVIEVYRDMVSNHNPTGKDYA